ncbi:hypothetical protein LWC34_08685 [Kibdelosporangium philippinense]|uniref:Uncharacterized protein n=1 Tax=Kibdelosporangium philippinense TaxID=211113 RepID=A0ABS8ZAQ4_9PSEU|nr:hypothetical protein [Kibdelosporangium philippinense]MCE7002907.1 hypothetical protein [Kibdelosporangium philippinense]
MHAQLTYFDGPRSPEEIAAAEFAGTHRIEPLIATFDNVSSYVLQREDGSWFTVTIADSEQTLREIQKAIMSMDLLPGEDVALLRGPDRVELFPVVAAHLQGA